MRDQDGILLLKQRPNFVAQRLFLGVIEGRDRMHGDRRTLQRVVF